MSKVIITLYFCSLFTHVYPRVTHIIWVSAPNQHPQRYLSLAMQFKLFSFISLFQTFYSIGSRRWLQSEISLAHPSACIPAHQSFRTENISHSRLYFSYSICIHEPKKHLWQTNTTRLSDEPLAAWQALSLRKEVVWRYSMLSQNMLTYSELQFSEWLPEVLVGIVMILQKQEL